MTLTASRSGAAFERAWHRDQATSLRFAAAYAGSDPLIASLGSKYTIFIQRITVLITTDAAQSLTIRDSATTPVVFAVVPASPGLGLQTFEFGDEGIPATVGKDIDAVVSGAGLAGNLDVECYAKIVPATAGVVASDL
jgi:hypothetical protein